MLDDLLRKIKVKPGTTPEDMAQIVNQAMTNAPITFSDEDLPKPHSFHNNALYIVVRTRGMTVSHVLVDGGSSLNICPEMTAKALGLKEEEYVPDPITIYGFDNHGQTAQRSRSFWKFSSIIQCTQFYSMSSTCHPLIIFCWDEHGSITLMPFHQPSHQCIKWSKGGMITTILGEDPEERLPQPMIPRSTFTADIPSIRESWWNQPQRKLRNAEAERCSAIVLLLGVFWSFDLIFEIPNLGFFYFQSYHISLCLIYFYLNSKTSFL